MATGQISWQLGEWLHHHLDDATFLSLKTLQPRHLCCAISQKHTHLFDNFVGELMEAIKRDFGSFQKMKEKMSAVTVAVQGSGWGWLGFDKDSGRLRIAACANQDPLQGTTGQLDFLWFGAI